MNNRTYLSYGTVILFCLVLIASLYMMNWYLILICLVYGVLAFLFYRRKNFISVKENNDIVFSPIFGKVIKVGGGADIGKRYADFNFIDLRHALFEDIGIFFPFSSEFSFHRKIKGNRLFLPLKKLPKNEKNLHQEIVLIKESSELFFIKLYSTFVSSQAIIFPTSGDYGYLGAQFGVFSGAGIVRFFIPKKYSILCQEGQKVTPGNNILAKK
ncbi:hypothetical protein N9N67_08320 [Bacteriovoracaceae bacterium]|nr:hypothetical protein [Bacteriovoracaceae bacterium]